jgi:hypothetical protein
MSLREMPKNPYMALLYVIALAISALFVSVLAATFSVSGLARLFTGAALAVTLMGASLEFSKFVAAAFLHRVWGRLNVFYRSYLLIAVVVLSAITSMGIFGFLSDAYQASSSDLQLYAVKISAVKDEQTRNNNEIARLNHSVDEIPASRVTKRLELRRQIEPQLQELFAKNEKAADNIKQMDLKVLEIKNKVGPLIYIAKAFNQDIDTVVKWLILVFVSVFDPLAICLVIATSEALRLRSLGYLDFPKSISSLMRSRGGAGKDEAPADHIVEMRFAKDSAKDLPKAAPKNNSEKVG